MYAYDEESVSGRPEWCGMVCTHTNYLCTYIHRMVSTLMCSSRKFKGLPVEGDESDAGRL
jgi:hypothetical protein